MAGTGNVPSPCWVLVAAFLYPPDLLGYQQRDEAGHVNWLRKQRWLLSVVLVAAVLGLGVLLTWLVVERMGIHGGAVAVSCLLLPALVVLAFTGRLSEISAGGVTARFR